MGRPAWPPSQSFRANLMRALMRRPSRHFRRINDGYFAAGLSLFSHMDLPSQRLHLGQPASKGSDTGDRRARSDPGWFKWERSAAHFCPLLKANRRIMSSFARGCASAAATHIHDFARPFGRLKAMVPAPAFIRSCRGAAACEMDHIWCHNQKGSTFPV